MPSDLQRRAELVARQLMEDLATDHGGPVWLPSQCAPNAAPAARFVYHTVVTAALLKDTKIGADLTELESTLGARQRWSLAAGDGDEPDTIRIVRRWPTTNFALGVFF